MEWNRYMPYYIILRERERMTINGMKWIEMEEEQGNITVQYHIVLYYETESRDSDIELYPKVINVSFEMRKC